MKKMQTPIAYSHIPITSNKVGSWRSNEPYLKEKKAPCQVECPIGQDIRSIMDLMQQGKDKEAFYLMVSKNPFLFTTGTVCPHFCEQGCNRQYIDQSLNISHIEKYLGQKYLYENISVLKEEKVLDKKVAIIGGGPSGISAAFQLALSGVKVDVFEREAELGGIVHFGIPDFRLKKEIFKKEIERVLNSFPEINLQLNTEIKPENLEEMKKNYDKIFLAAGLHSPISSNFNNVAYGLESLKNYHKKNFSFPAKGQYLVLGGGNTAMDVALYLLKSDNKVAILVRKNKNQMKAYAEEIQMVEQFGGKILDKSQLKSWNEEEKKAVLDLQGEETAYQADGIFVCFGQTEENMWKNIENDSKLIKIGDISGIRASMADAVSSGRQTALNFMGKTEKTDTDEEIADIKKINVDYWNDKTELRVENPFQEAHRCIQCGICTSCGVCETFCPDFTAKSKTEQVNFNYDYCKGCGICVEECPRGAISERGVR